MKKTYLATAVAALFASPITTAIAADALLDDVVVSSSRSEQRSFDAPGSIQSVNRVQIESGGPQINLSESLAGIPGINAANRNNYAQDLQVSIRGFGARAPFGVRGVKMFQDGIPMSLADGQGQTSQFALTSADRIEVLKGPISSLYGNASGGVLQVFTRNPGDKPELIIADTIGSYGLNHKNVQYSEKRGDISFVVDSSNFKSDGFREYSSVEREHLNAKFVIETERGKVGILANYLDNKFAQEPGSRTLLEYQTNPYGAIGDNKNRGYGKSFTQGIYGLTFDGKLDNENSYSYRVYAGDRKLNNPGGTLFVIDRKIMGGAANISTKTNVGSVPVKIMTGLEYDQMKDYRLGYSWDDVSTWSSSFSRRENNLASSYGGFLQSEWLLNDQYTALLGLRYTNVKLEVEDFYPVNLNATPPNPNSSGAKKFEGISPVAGLTYHLNQNSNIYFQIGRGFETPTINEVLYTTTSAGSTNKFDNGVSSAKTIQSEFGYKWRGQDFSRFDVAFFHAKTSNDIVPYAIRSIGSTWTNADTTKFGLEISAATVIAENIIFRGAFTATEAKYDQPTYSYAGALVTSAGNKVPGIPTYQLYADLAWRSHSWVSKPKVTYSEFGVDIKSTGKINVDSRNSYTIDTTTISNANMVTTSSYYLLGARASHSYKRGPHNLTFFGRLDNLLDKKHVGSVVVNQESGKYYEPGMPRNWIVGVKYSLAMN